MFRSLCHESCLSLTHSYVSVNAMCVGVAPCMSHVSLSLPGVMSLSHVESYLCQCHVCGCSPRRESCLSLMNHVSLSAMSHVTLSRIIYASLSFMSHVSLSVMRHVSLSRIGYVSLLLVSHNCVNIRTPCVRVCEREWLYPHPQIIFVDIATLICHVSPL